MLATCSIRFGGLAHLALDLTTVLDNWCHFLGTVRLLHGTAFLTCSLAWLAPARSPRKLNSFDFFLL
jgi:hypothetical protein